MLTEEIGLFYLDSGAHGLYNRNKHSATFYNSERFFDYVDSYARFVLLHDDVIDHYANVDVIFDPARSWRVLKYLESEYELQPMPVIHFGTPIKWITRHLDAGYEYLGIGGVRQGVAREKYFAWADSVFKLLCPNPKRRPIVRTHGFAITAHDLLFRYPWDSVDSSSWIKRAGNYAIYVPRRVGQQFRFDLRPLGILVGRNATALSKNRRRSVRAWLEEIDVPWTGVVTDYQKRAIANQRYFQRLFAELPYMPTGLLF
jgi:hypothetical protein